MPSQTFKLKPRIIQAGAGTGKTTCLTREVFRILQGFKDQQDRYPSLIICTFTRKATQELKRKLYQEAIKREDRKLLAHISSPSIHISTIHGILTLFLKNHGYKYDCDFSNFESNNLIKEEYLANRIASNLLFGKYFPLLEKAPFPELKRALRFYVKNKLMNPKIHFFSEKDLKELEETDQFFLKNEKSNPLPEQKKVSDFFEDCLKEEPECFQSELFAGFFQDFKPLADEFFKEFLSQKKQNGVITMEDLELWSLDLLNRNPETGRIFSEEWDYWFIDEYQDTSWMQEQIFQKITGFKNVFCVGDPQQSIYLFREADPEVFKRRVKSCQEPMEKLEINYRSQSPLIYFFNDFFPKEKGFIPLFPSKRKSASLDKNTPYVYFIYYDVNTPPQEEENIHFKEAVYFQIQRLLKKGYSPKDITILGMKNEHLSQLGRFLRQKGLSVRIHSSKGLTENRIILDALFLFKFLINPHDDENLLALFRTPYFRISDDQLAKWCQTWDISKKSFSHKHSNKQQLSEKDISIKENSSPPVSPEKNNIKESSKVLSVLKNEEASSHSIKENQIHSSLSLWSFLQKQQPHQEIIQTLKIYLNLTKEQGILSVFEQALFKGGLMDLTEFQDPSGVSESYLWNLLAQMRDSQKTLKHPLELFYSFMEGTENEISFQDTLTMEDSDCIQLMTVHSSKGLQFKNVIVFDLSKSIRFNAPKEECVFDREKGLMAFSVPLNGREQKSVKCYAHKKYAENKKQQEAEEKDRLLYVALTRAEETVTIMAPAKKPSANSWFQRFGFFRELENIPLKKNSKKALENKSIESSTGSDKRESSSSDQTGFVKTGFVKTGLHIKRNYCLLVEHNPVEEKPYQNETPSPSLLQPFNSIQTRQPHQKTAGDFVRDKNPSTRKTDFILTREKNIFFKTDQGRYLHDCLRLLNIHSLDVLQKKISQRDFSAVEKNNILSALRWINDLEEPNMKLFLKTGFAEWPFQWKTKTATLQGRIDLWGWKDDVLWVFDYK
ncbi:MAG: UvrD-helicase domain-containing protein, partial [Bdellovibrionales bacterium]|nr:UvrD-helicase domain-containing protein [Bdellovibrionales bacterium]